MALNLIVPILLAATVGFITYLLTRRRVQRNAAGPELAEAKSALSTAKADFAARQEELRNFINDARERENAAKAEATKSDERCTDVAEESDTPRGAGGLMSWAVSKTADPWV